ncbi:hypothetical protein Pelo_11632 [Pelomyxa schiedti]|nr:hypothetical protein Pelo_11632 [Pelomyxa schiedti]
MSKSNDPNEIPDSWESLTDDHIPNATGTPAHPPSTPASECVSSASNDNTTHETVDLTSDRFFAAWNAVFTWLGPLESCVALSAVCRFFHGVLQNEQLWRVWCEKSPWCDSALPPTIPLEQLPGSPLSWKSHFKQCYDVWKKLHWDPIVHGRDVLVTDVIENAVTFQRSDQLVITNRPLMPREVVFYSIHVVQPPGGYHWNDILNVLRIGLADEEAVQKYLHEDLWVVAWAISPDTCAHYKGTTLCRVTKADYSTDVSLLIDMNRREADYYISGELSLKSVFKNLPDKVWPSASLGSGRNMMITAKFWHPNL